MKVSPFFLKTWWHFQNSLSVRPHLQVNISLLILLPQRCAQPHRLVAFLCSPSNSSALHCRSSFVAGESSMLTRSNPFSFVSHWTVTSLAAFLALKYPTCHQAWYDCSHNVQWINTDCLKGVQASAWRNYAACCNLQLPCSHRFSPDNPCCVTCQHTFSSCREWSLPL